MTTEQRVKAIRAMVEGIARHPMLADEFKVGMAALAEELRQLRRLTVCGGGACDCDYAKLALGKCPLK